MTMDGMPEIEPCLSRAGLEVNPYSSCGCLARGSRGRRDLQGHRAVTAVSTLGQHRVEPRWTGPRAELEPSRCAVTSVEGLGLDDTA
ncbi:MAG: hypothetical protein QOK30_442 [Nocardioidaceae bacterium]|nr:hypothetical protein [Nocardioidaceae bacterium]